MGVFKLEGRGPGLGITLLIIGGLLIVISLGLITEGICIDSCCS